MYMECEILFSYCPLLRQNIFFYVSVFHDNDNWEWLYMFEVVVFQ